MTIDVDQSIPITPELQEILDEQLAPVLAALPSTFFGVKLKVVSFARNGTVTLEPV